MKRDLAVLYARSFLGLPYIWGGDDPVVGFDCSGLVQEILAGVGIDPTGDQTAQGLHDFFFSRAGTAVSAPGPGALIFFGASKRQITHIGFMLDEFHMIEAGGGGSKTLTPSDASKQNAYVRIRPISRRTDCVAILNPAY